MQPDSDTPLSIPSSLEDLVALIYLTMEDLQKTIRLCISRMTSSEAGTDPTVLVPPHDGVYESEFVVTSFVPRGGVQGFSPIVESVQDSRQWGSGAEADNLDDIT